jgi:hypothetical protein
MVEGHKGKAEIGGSLKCELDAANFGRKNSVKFQSVLSV